MTPEKLCIDCKYYKKHFYLDLCIRPETITKNPVTGEIKHSYCIVERQDYFVKDSCGNEAKYFEPVDSIVLNSRKERKKARTLLQRIRKFFIDDLILMGG